MTRAMSGAAQRSAVALVAGLASMGALAGCAANPVSVDEPTTDPSTGPTTSAETSAPPAQAGTDSGAAGDSDYVDGTYSADGSYQSPNGTETVTVTVTIADDVVTEVDVVGHATGGNSKQFQGQFASGIAAEVVGVALEDVDVSRVAGSSLTSGGFNNAIDEIQAQAQA